MARRKRKKAPQQPKVTGPNYTGPLIIAVVILVAIIGIMHFANADRSWQEYIGAGARQLRLGRKNVPRSTAIRRGQGRQRPTGGRNQEVSQTP